MNIKFVIYYFYKLCQHFHRQEPTRIKTNHSNFMFKFMKPNFFFPLKKSKTWSIQEYRYKILVVGSCGCGKTSIIRRFIKNEFSPSKEVWILGFINAFDKDKMSYEKEINWDKNSVIILKFIESKQKESKYKLDWLMIRFMYGCNCSDLCCRCHTQRSTGGSPRMETRIGWTFKFSPKYPPRE